MSVGWLWYVLHSTAVMVLSSVGVVAVVVPGCLSGWFGLLGWAAFLVLWDVEFAEKQTQDPMQ